MKTLTIHLLRFIFAFSTFHLTCQELDTTVTNLPLQSRLDVGYSIGQLAGISQSYSEVGVRVPVYVKSSSMSLVDFRGYRLDNSKWGLSSGFVFRNRIKSGAIVGGNLYYDLLQGQFNRLFNRLGLGLEWLGESLDFRFNAYIPLGKQNQHSKKHIYNNYIGNYTASCRENQFSIGKGLDAELGGRFCCYKNLVTYAAIGPYFYSSKRVSSYFGGQARIEVCYNSTISFQLRSSYDAVNRLRAQGQIQLSFPLEILSKKINTFCENMFLQPIRRNGVIFTKGYSNYKWNW